MGTHGVLRIFSENKKEPAALLPRLADKSVTFSGSTVSIAKPCGEVKTYAYRVAERGLYMTQNRYVQRSVEDLKEF